VSIFRRDSEVRNTQKALNDYAEYCKDNGIHEETPEYLRLNHDANEARRNAKQRRR
jgi:hypothetical protein